MIPWANNSRRQPNHVVVTATDPNVIDDVDYFLTICPGDPAGRVWVAMIWMAAEGIGLDPLEFV